MKILVAMRVEDEHKEILEASAREATTKDVEFVYCYSASVTEDMAQSADIIIGNVPPNLIKGNKNLKLMQLNSAGTDGYTEPGILPEQAVLTNATGAYGLAISEHMIGMLLCLMKKLDIYHDNMKDCSWKDEGTVTSIWNSKTLVVGLGDIGSEFAKRMNAMGSDVSAIKRNPSDKPEYIDKMYKMEQLSEALSESDIVAACLPGTKETYKIFNKEIFSKMKPGSWFINVGRGNAVDLDALIEVLNEGKIAGACLDVTDPEPLPEDHPLWKTPNVLLTPHVSGGYHLKETHDRIIRIAARNIKHIINGEQIENIVDMQTGYRKSSC